MTRRRFAFWVGMLLFWLGERLQADVMDAAAKAILTWTDPKGSKPSRRARWQANENITWRWYERFTLDKGERTITGITTPVNKITGKPIEGKEGYLDEDQVPSSVKRSAIALRKKLSIGKIDLERRAKDGRPPSQWLRSLNADEIRLWLKTIDVPEVGVDGMTFSTHLTRDHSFSAERILGLTIPEQKELHSAAHYGY